MSHTLITACRLVLVGTTLVSVLVSAPSASAADSPLAAQARVVPPGNDTFAAARLITGESGEVVATNAEATKETGEPAHAGNAGGSSVWFRWTAARSGTLTVWVAVPTFNSLLGVYTGTGVDTLTEIASNDDYGSGTASRVTFSAASGTEYRIAIDGAGGANGPFRLRWRQGPENDNFADARVLTDPSGSAEGSSFGATVEPGETLELSAASSWYRWTAPENRNFGFVVFGARGLTVSTGSSIETLTPVGETGSVVVFPAVAGTVYRIRVAGYSWNTTDPFTLRWSGSPANDSFSSATAIEGTDGNTTGTTVFASVEPGEPARGENSVWYTWTAPVTGHVRFDAWALRDAIWEVDTVLTVYRGATVDTLSVVARNDDWYWTRLPTFGSALSFRAVAGTTYSISVNAFSSFSWGPFGLRWYPGAIIFGNSANNHIAGTPGRDFLNGRGGADLIHGLGGNDFVVGGSGRDRLYGDAGPDVLISRDGVRGNDVIYGGSGRDIARRDRSDGVHGVP
jgi:Ca2+-binding RTX toxin-like protein